MKTCKSILCIVFFFVFACNTYGQDFAKIRFKGWNDVIVSFDWPRKNIGYFKTDKGGCLIQNGVGVMPSLMLAILNERPNPSIEWIKEYDLIDDYSVARNSIELDVVKWEYKDDTTILHADIFFVLNNYIYYALIDCDKKDENLISCFIDSIRREWQ